MGQLDANFKPLKRGSGLYRNFDLVKSIVGFNTEL